MHDCSWVKVHENEKLADLGITEEEANRKNQEFFNKCDKKDD